MTLLLVVLLVLLWGAVIVPALINHRNNRAGPDSFRRHLEALSTGRRAPSRAKRASTSVNAGRWIMGPPPSRARPRPASAQRRPAPIGRALGATRATVGSRGGSRSPAFRSEWAALDPIIEKRRHVFIGLVIGVVATLLLGLIPSLGILLKLNIVLDVALVGYIVYLVMTKPQPMPAELAAAGFDDLGDANPQEEHWLRAGEL